MSDLMTDEEQLIWFLREFENAEDDQLEDCELEIYGEDDQGREGTCTISVQEIAKKAADFIQKLTADRDNALAQNAELVAMVASLCEKLKDIEDTESDKPYVYRLQAKQALRLVNGSPTHQTRDRDAEVGRAGFIEGVRQMAENEIGWFGHDADSCANHYAEKVRRGEI